MVPLPGELPPLLGCNPKRSSNSSPDGDIPYSPLLQATMLPSYCMAGRCCPYCAIRRAELSYISGIARLRKTECVNNCDSSQVAIHGTISRCQRVGHQVYSIPWPPSCPGALPTRCTIEGAPLLAFAVDAAIQDALWRQSHTCTR